MADDVILTPDEREMVMLAVHTMMASIKQAEGTAAARYGLPPLVAAAKKMEGVDKQLVVRSV
jgi:hypothetical protein